MSEEQNTDLWEEEATARLSEIEEIAEQTDSEATKQLRQQVSKLIRAKDKPEQNSESKLPEERIIDVLGDLLDRVIEAAPDNEYTKIPKEEKAKIKAKKNFRKPDYHMIFPPSWKPSPQ